MCQKNIVSVYVPMFLQKKEAILGKIVKQNRMSCVN